MDPDFWHARWRDNEIGFHQDDINPHLQRYWSQLGATAGARVLVPLCGKSRDMLWLAGEGFRVLGVEVSPIAVAAFFADNGLRPTSTEDTRFIRRQADEITLIEGDFFALARADVAPLDAVYDRASLIALPPEMRQKYAKQMAALLPSGVPVLLITLDYPQSQMDGPPFSVGAAEVERLFGRTFTIETLASIDILPENPRFQSRGLSHLLEQAYRLVRQ